MADVNVIPHAIPAVWLHANQRVVWISSISCVLLSAAMAGGAMYFAYSGLWDYVISFVTYTCAPICFAVFIWLFAWPRIKYQPGELLILSKSGFTGHYDPVPIGLVDCFLLHKTANPLFGRFAPTVICIVIRLDERAPDFAYRRTHPIFLTWCGSQITIIGNMCEPIDLELVQRLNRWLTLAKREAAAKELA